MIKAEQIIAKHIKKTITNAGVLKKKSTLDKKLKLKLSNVYSKKLPKFKLEKQLNTICKRKHANHTSNNNIVNKLLNKNTYSRSDSNSSDKYENIATQKLTTQQKKTEKANKNGIKHS